MPSAAAPQRQGDGRDAGRRAAGSRTSAARRIGRVRSGERPSLVVASSKRSRTPTSRSLGFALHGEDGIDGLLDQHRLARGRAPSACAPGSASRCAFRSSPRCATGATACSVGVVDRELTHLPRPGRRRRRASSCTAARAAHGVADLQGQRRLPAVVDDDAQDATSRSELRHKGGAR